MGAFLLDIVECAKKVVETRIHWLCAGDTIIPDYICNPLSSCTSTHTHTLTDELHLSRSPLALSVLQNVAFSVTALALFLLPSANSFIVRVASQKSRNPANSIFQCKIFSYFHTYDTTLTHTHTHTHIFWDYASCRSCRWL